MPLQNRVDPFGDIHAVDGRGGLMGNRGGRIHRDDRTLGRRRWASKSWISCSLEFKGRQRAVMGPSYTELFFHDEATALAAGHRPCFECRRRDAVAFAEAWGRAQGFNRIARAWEMDVSLHAERIERGAGGGWAKRTTRVRLDELPPGVMVSLWGATWLVAPHYLLRWSFEGYAQALRRTDYEGGLEAELLTPPSIVAAIRAGYAPAVDSPLF